MAATLISSDIPRSVFDQSLVQVGIHLVDLWLFLLHELTSLCVDTCRLISKSHTLPLGRENHLKGSSKQHALELMLQEIPGVTPSGSVGIAEEWKSFRRLMQGFEQKEKEEGIGKGKVLLEGCKVGLLALFCSQPHRNLI